MNEKVNDQTGEITEDEASVAEKNSRSFSVVIAGLQYGELNQKLSDGVQELISDMTDYSAKYGNKVVNGSMSLALKFKLDDGVMQITSDYKFTPPVNNAGSSFMFVTADNNLTDENPRQRGFDFGGAAQPIRG